MSKNKNNLTKGAEADGIPSLEYEFIEIGGADYDSSKNKIDKETQVRIDHMRSNIESKMKEKRFIRLLMDVA